jgi:hypothetical protein
MTLRAAPFGADLDVERVPSKVAVLVSLAYLLLGQFRGEGS